MDNIPVAASAAQVTNAKAASVTSEAPAPGAPLPWLSAFQAALTFQETENEPPFSNIPATLAAAAGSADPADIVSGDGESRDTSADAAPATEPAGIALPFFAVLPATSSGMSAAPGQFTPGDPRLVAGNDAITAPAHAVIKESGTGSERLTNTGFGAKELNRDPDAAASAATTHVAPELTARADTATRAAELAATRVSERGAAHAPEVDAARIAGSGETMAQAQVQFVPTTVSASAPPAAAPPAAQLHIDSAVNSAAWGGELAQKVVWMAGEKQHVAELHLNPPDLGPLDIKLTVNEHQTTAVFTSPHSAVREAVESALPRLREVLADSGILLGNASVTSDTPRDGSAFASQQEQARRGTFYVPARDTVAAGERLITGDSLRRRGLVDLFA